MEHNQLILSAKDVNIQFNLRGKVLHAIRGIDLDLYQGEVLAIVGESGSGKSVFTKSFIDSPACIVDFRCFTTLGPPCVGSCNVAIEVTVGIGETFCKEVSETSTFFICKSW